MSKIHTPLSATLLILGGLAFLAKFFLPVILPESWLAIARNTYFMLPLCLLSASYLAMRPKEGTPPKGFSRNVKALRYAIIYSRLAAGLIAVSAFGAFGNKLRVDILDSFICEFEISLFLIFLVSSILFSVKLARYREKCLNDHAEH